MGTILDAASQINAGSNVIAMPDNRLTYKEGEPLQIRDMTTDELYAAVESLPANFDTFKLNFAAPRGKHSFPGLEMQYTIARNGNSFPSVEATPKFYRADVEATPEGLALFQTSVNQGGSPRLICIEAREGTAEPVKSIAQTIKKGGYIPSDGDISFFDYSTPDAMWANVNFSIDQQPSPTVVPRLYLFTHRIKTHLPLDFSNPNNQKMKPWLDAVVETYCRERGIEFKGC